MSTNTQICKTCHENKPLNQFHRRRNSYQAQCKECRNEIEAARYQKQGKQALPRITSPINKQNFTALQERITTLEPRLRAKASAFAHDNLDADDIYGAMVEAILTKSQPEESDAYILQRANWTAQAYIAKTLTYSQYVEDFDVDESDAEHAGFRVVTNPRQIEDDLVKQEKYAEIKAVIETLPAENRKIVAMISIGYSQREVAAELKVSEQKISESMKQIRATLKLSLA